MVTVGPVAVDVQHLLCAGNSWCWVSDLGWLLFALLVSWSSLILQKNKKRLGITAPFHLASFPLSRFYIYCFHNVKQAQIYFWLTKYQHKRNKANKQESRFPKNLRIFICLCSTNQPYCFSKENMYPLALKSSLQIWSLLPEIVGKDRK